MRRLIPFLAVLVPSLGAASCNNAVLIKFGDMIYQTSCREQLAAGHGGCTGLVHDTNFSDGEAGAHVSCGITMSGANKSLSFDVSGHDMTGQSFRLMISNVVYSASGAGMSGSLSLIEGATTYSGRVSSAAPTAAFPCQVTGVMQTMDSDMNQQIQGDILCQHLVASADPSQIREVEAVSSPNHPFGFRIVFCDGLVAP